MNRLRSGFFSSQEEQCIFIVSNSFKLCQFFAGLGLAPDDFTLSECLHCPAFVGAVEESSCALDGATDSIFFKASQRTDHACFQDPYRLPLAAIECSIEVYLNISSHARFNLKPQMI